MAYEKYPGITSLTNKQRVLMFKETIMESIEQGLYTLDELRETIPKWESDEQYEAAQAATEYLEALANG